MLALWAPNRQVTEEFDITVEPGWNEFVQLFEEHPDRPGERLDSRRDGPIPNENHYWVILRPPR